MKNPIRSALDYLNAHGNLLEILHPLSVQGSLDIGSILNSLLVLQNSDGGWSFSGLGKSSVQATASMISIAADRTDSAVLRKGAEFILDRQKGNGGWSEVTPLTYPRERFSLNPYRGNPRISIRKSVTWLTAHCGHALHKMRLGESAVDRAIEFLLASQNSNGSWSPYLFYDSEGEGDPFSTGEVVSFLVSMGYSPLEEPLVSAVDLVASPLSLNGDWSQPLNLLGMAKVLNAAGPDYEDKLETTVSALVRSQNEDGGWNPVSRSMPSDPQLTSWITVFLLENRVEG